MSDHSVTAASPAQKWLAGSLVVVYALITIMPLLWITSTGVNTPADAIA